MGDSDDFVASSHQVRTELEDVVLYASNSWIEEVGDHCDGVSLAFAILGGGGVVASWRGEHKRCRGPVMISAQFELWPKLLPLLQVCWSIRGELLDRYIDTCLIESLEGIQSFYFFLGIIIQ